MKRQAVAFALALVVSGVGMTAGCSHFEAASKEECEQAVKHMIRVLAKDEAGDGVVGRLLGVAANAAVSITGDGDEAVSKCMGSASRADVQCILRSDTAADIEKCD